MLITFIIKMSIIKKVLDVAELEKQLEENEKLQYLFISSGKNS